MIEVKPTLLNQAFGDIEQIPPIILGSNENVEVTTEQPGNSLIVSSRQGSFSIAADRDSSVSVYTTELNGKAGDIEIQGKIHSPYSNDYSSPANNVFNVSAAGNLTLMDSINLYLNSSLTCIASEIQLKSNSNIYKGSQITFDGNTYAKSDSTALEFIAISEYSKAIFNGSLDISVPNRPFAIYMHSDLEVKGPARLHSLRRYAIYVTNNSTATFYDDVELVTTNTSESSSAYGAYVSTNGNLIIKGNLSVDSQMTGIVGILSSNIQIDGLVTVKAATFGGFRLYGQSTGTFGGGIIESNQAYNPGMSADNGSTINVNGPLSVTTQGWQADGILAKNNSQITLKDLITVCPADEYSHGVFALDNSAVMLSGGTISIPDSDYPAYAVYAADSSCILSYDQPAVYTINGDIRADDNSRVSLGFDTGSSVFGAATMEDKHSSIIFDMKESLWQLRKPSEITLLNATSSVVNLTGKRWDAQSGNMAEGAWLPFGNVLTLKTLTGNHSTFVLHTDIAAGQATQMSILNSGSGTHHLYVHNEVNEALAVMEDGVELVSVNGLADDLAFVLANEAEVNALGYELRKYTDEENRRVIWKLMPVISA